MDTADFDKYQKQDKYVVNDSKFYQSYLKHKGFTYNLTGKERRRRRRIRSTAFSTSSST